MSITLKYTLINKLKQARHRTHKIMNQDLTDFLIHPDDMFFPHA